MSISSTKPIKKSIKPIGLAIVGWGAAGRARAKAINEHPKAHLYDIISRHQPKLQKRSVAEILKDPAVEALAVSTENTNHPWWIEKALAHQKHILCDYPLTFKGKQLKQWLELFQKQNCILHAEHIGLLSSSHQQLIQKKIKPADIISGNYQFLGGWSSKIFDETKTGPFYFLALSRLAQIWDWFGPFYPELKNYTANEQFFEIVLKLQLAKGGFLDFSEKRKPGLPRKRCMNLSLKNNQKLEWQPQLKRENLFLKDLDWFLLRCQNPQKKPYFSNEDLIGLYQAMDQITHQIKLIKN